MSGCYCKTSSLRQDRDEARLVAVKLLEGLPRSTSEDEVVGYFRSPITTRDRRIETGAVPAHVLISTFECEPHLSMELGAPVTEERMGVCCAGCISSDKTHDIIIRSARSPHLSPGLLRDRSEWPTNAWLGQTRASTGGAHLPRGSTYCSFLKAE